jgi:hypothetical protein
MEMGIISLTPHTATCRGDTAPAQVGVGAPDNSEIEVTPDMILVGRRILDDGYTIDAMSCGDLSPEGVVVEIFQAMFRVRPGRN